MKLPADSDSRIPNCPASAFHKPPLAICNIMAQTEDIETRLDDEAISMHRIFTDDQENEQVSRLTPPSDNVNLDSQAPLAPPTRTYQVMLLIAGSMMIFHIIGINQVFGIFQVRVALRDLSFSRHSSLSRSFIRPQKPISLMLKDKMLLCHLWALLEQD